MRDLIAHEKFEIEVLEALNSQKLLQPLVFGGGSMLRLCHDLNRYSADLDFWFVKTTDASAYHKRMKVFLKENYIVSDAFSKRYTLVYEFRTARYPRSLKIEIRKEIKDCKWKEMIAFSKHSHIQVLIKAMTLEQMMQNKIQAFLERGEIRDCFDMEFMLSQGVFIQASQEELEEIRKKLLQFKKRDFAVTLGSLLDGETREYYKKNGMEYLVGTINSLISK